MNFYGLFGAILKDIFENMISVGFESIRVQYIYYIFQ